jgi:hypothetical protein
MYLIFLGLLRTLSNSGLRFLHSSGKALHKAPQAGTTLGRSGAAAVIGVALAETIHV